MLKTTRSSKQLAPKMFKANDDEVVSGGDDKTNKIVRNSSKKSTHMPNIGVIGESNFLTPNAKETFNYYG